MRKKFVSICAALILCSATIMSSCGSANYDDKTTVGTPVNDNTSKNSNIPESVPYQSIADVSSVSDIPDVSIVSDMSDLSSASEISDMSSISDISDVSDVSNISDISSVSDISYEMSKEKDDILQSSDESVEICLSERPYDVLATSKGCQVKLAEKDAEEIYNLALESVKDTSLMLNQLMTDYNCKSAKKDGIYICISTDSFDGDIVNTKTILISLDENGKCLSGYGGSSAHFVKSEIASRILEIINNSQIFATPYISGEFIPMHSELYASCQGYQVMLSDDEKKEIYSLAIKCFNDDSLQLKQLLTNDECQAALKEGICVCIISDFTDKEIYMVISEKEVSIIGNIDSSAYSVPKEISDIISKIVKNAEKSDLFYEPTSAELNTDTDFEFRTVLPNITREQLLSIKNAFHTF